MNNNRTVVHIWHRMLFYRIQTPMQTRYKQGHFKELCLHTDLVLVFDIKSSTFDQVFHHWQVSIEGYNVECCILFISEIKHVNSHLRSKVLGNANMTTHSRQVKSIESTLWMYVQHKQNTIHTDIHTVHDTENLTFSADDRAENPHISARTISGFRAEQLASSIPIMIFRTILAACFSIL